MQLQRELPAVLEAWLEYVGAHERLVAETSGDGPLPSFEMMVVFAGAMVADASGGVLDPAAGGTRVLLPNGDRALVAVACEERGPDFGLVLDPDSPVADWIVLVAFRRSIPVAIHVLPSAQARYLRDTLGVSAPVPPRAPAGAMVLSTTLHWNLCLERLSAELCDVRTYYFSPLGLSPEPHPITLPPLESPPAQGVA